MGWQRKSYPTRKYQKEGSWRNVQEWIVKRRFCENLGSTESVSVMEDMMESGRLKSVNGFWYRFVKD